jgi:hypothetical protein
MSLALKRNQVVDIVLTKLAQGYSHPDTIGENIFPRMIVPVVWGSYIQWNKDAFKLFNTARPIGSKATRVDFSFAKKSFVMGDGMSLDAAIDDREDQETHGISNLNLGNAKRQMIQRIFEISREKGIADIVTNVANFSTNHAAASHAWDGTATVDIRGDVMTGITTILNNIGTKPTDMVVSRDVWIKMSADPKLLDVYKYTNAGFLTEDQIAKTFGLNSIQVGEATYVNDANVVVPIWGTGLAVLYFKGTASGDGVQDPTDMAPACGYDLQLKGLPRVVRYRDEAARSEVVGVDDNFYPLQTSVDAWYKITGI